ncbi:nidogen-2 isoform X2 [Alosa sapidissima]|uniref:nidogen-2 isoform X2 n=1 Tax=Alosa sapidissima TaxID=34773 RepID=UPI001C07FC77|nr:nidogen-2 isoform X2 [Alosa sapidissima]
MTRNKFTILFIQLCWTVYVVTGIHRKDIFPYGTLSGDLTLQEGDDETSKVIVLTRPMRFYEASFSSLYVATNGIISTQDLPMEKQYVDDGLPTDFPVIAPFLADLDTSNGRGTIYYRQTESPTILNRVAMEVHRGFPDARFTPTHAVVVTWENVGAYEEGSRSSDGSSNRVNTFQAVLAYDETDTYGLLLYPEGGLNFFGTRPKESYNVEIELPARVGFSRGEVSFLFFSRQEGPFYSITTNEQSVKNLYQVGNTGLPGVWLFHIGSSYSFDNVIPAAVGGVLATPPPFDAEATTPEYSEYSDYPEFQSPTLPEFVEAGADPSLLQSPDQPQVQLYGEEVPLTASPETPESPNSESGPRQHPAIPEPRNLPPEHSGLPQRPVPEHTILELFPTRDGGSPRHSPKDQVDSVVQGVDLDTGVIQYNGGSKETCERFSQQCSQNAYCSDYATGLCCHCRSGFYGNGQHCLPSGAPHRVNGKVNGVVLVGSTPVEINNVDLHAYVVVSDGRAYTAISEVPEPAGWALMPVAPVGGLFGWLFALELPNSQNGFTITGAEFTRHADVTFYPGNERLSIVQTAKGLDAENYLSVDTKLSGSVPFIPPGATVQMEPFKVTFQYYPSVTTSISVREFTVVSAESGAETFSFQLRQNITHNYCRHGPRSGPETLELSVERVFAMFVKEERILRYAITNKIGPVGAGIPDGGEVNPCYAGTHDCDTTAQCIPGEGQNFQCQCATGYRGDGRNCYDIDECAEHLSSCAAHSQCENLQGSHRCLCQPGYEFGFDGRTCIDVDECRSQPCHAQASCTNSLGSFHCQCQAGYHGNGFQCHPQSGGSERPKTHCERHRDSAQTSQDGFSLVGAFVPECDEAGQYRPLQCHGSTGHCWCVDVQGQERAGTRAPPSSPRPNCNEPERPKTQCEHHRDGAQTSQDGFSLGAFVPECDEAGQYHPLQCHGSTGHCWCVDVQGQERAGTRAPPSSPRPNCNEPERPKTQCEHHRDGAQTSQDGFSLGAFVPECDEAGQYRPLQCHGSTGHCWCVDVQGQERAGTRAPPSSPRPNCNEPERPKTQCEHHRDGAQTSQDGFSLGAFVPECDEAGQYRPLQCHGSTGHCWCVDVQGQERAGTRAPPSSPRPNCNEPVRPERPRTQCEHHRDSLQGSHGGVGAFVPQCDEAGQYRPLQCHGSSGHCWCVDVQGQERAGTRTLPGTPPTNCDGPERPERPETQCERHRDGAQTSQDGFSLVGAFVPECDEAGQYRPLQCHGSTGHCWCVDVQGQERAGTRAPPSSPRPNCNEPVRPERPRTQCEHHRDSLQGSHGGVGAFVPQCDEAGQYRPLQCHGSSGHCWCVDVQGQERAGTRTSAGTPPTNCDGPVPPTQRPETVCERWRASLIEHYGSQPDPHHYLPQCDSAGEFNPVQCYGDSSYCWCVDKDGREVPGTRANDAVKPACIPTVAPPTQRPLPRPDVTPPPTGGVSLLYAQGQQIGALPLTGTRMDKDKSSVLLQLHGSIVVGVAHDCLERKVYWTDIAGRTINRAGLAAGSEPEVLINTGLTSPEGLALDVVRRRMFWVDSTMDKIETSNLDGTGRRVLIDKDLVNPRAIIVDSSSGTVYWTDWNREAPKIEGASVDGQNRKVLVQEGIGLPNALTFNPASRQVCWGDAGTKRLECISPDGTGRQVIHSGLNYPFAMVFHANHFYYTDWRRDAIIGMSRGTSQFTDDYLPEQRSHLYGIALASPNCL